jgi:hypothetical protein
VACLVEPIPSARVLEVWDWVEPLLERVQVDNGFTIDDILTSLQTRDMQLWVVPNKAACVTTVQVFPQYRSVLVARLAGDDLHEWFDDLMGVIEDWARQLGCKYVEEFGRDGWAKVGKHRGYEKVFTVMRKAL